MVKVEFEYHDSYSRSDKWSKQSCICNSVQECKEFYGLGIDLDCEYRILSVTPVEES